MPEDHRTVLLSISATLIAGLVILVATVAMNGGFSINLFKQYVLPLIISAFTLFVFFVVLLLNNKRSARANAVKPPVQA